MRLRDYLRRESLTPLEFARKIRVSDESVRRYARGVRKPEPAIMGRIARVTKGDVQPNDFFNLKRS